MRATRWGSVRELDRRVRVGTPAFRSQPKRLQQLQSWRAMHALRSHDTIRRYARRQNVKPSSDLSLSRKIAYVIARV